MHWGETASSNMAGDFYQPFVSLLRLLLQLAVYVAPPVITTETGTNKVAAVDSVTFVRGPFRLFNPFNFSSDARTRISLFATNIPAADESVSAITVKAEDTQQNSYQLPVESVGRTPGYPWMTQIVVRLPDALAQAGDVSVQVSVRGTESNKALLSIQ